MDIQVNDILELKKAHPCGGKMFLVLRTGADVKIRCCQCLHEMLLGREKVEKAVKKISRNS